MNTKKIAYTALFTALIAITTCIAVPIPGSNGFFNPGDAMIMLCAVMSGGLIASIAGGIGAALADIILGYAIFAPFTLIIKAIEGFLMAILYRAFIKLIKNKSLSVILASIISALEMAAGYFVSEIFLYGYRASLASVPANLLQGLTAVIIAFILIAALNRAGIIDKFNRTININKPKE